jgi:hypothetical protein
MPSMPKKRCFVVQGFGKKQDYQSGRTLDLDASYEVIKEAVTAAGLVCVRADEIKHSGTIDKPMFEQILDADLVIADLSTYNVNAAYELGVRHALRPFSTIIVAEKGFNYPFDFSHIAIRNYEHLGPDIGRKEAKRFQEELSQAIQTILAGSQEDSPVYTFIPDLQPPGRAAMAAATVAATTAAPAATASLKEMMDRAKAAMRASDFDTAKVVLAALHALAPSDNAITQSLALATYKSGKPTAEAALLEAMQLLSVLAPTTSHDTETLGLWGAVHKRLWDLTKDPPYLDEAIRGYERGFQLRQDYYNGINLAFLLNLRAQIAQPADAIADWVVAGRVRRRVVEICAVEMASLTGSTAALSDEERRSNLASQYWVLATLREAAVGLEDEVAAEHWRAEAAKTEPADWMVKSTDEQVGRLKVLLGNSPLRQLQPLSP